MRRCAALLLVCIACDDPVDQLAPPEAEQTHPTRPLERGPLAETAPARIRHHPIRTFIADASRLELRSDGLTVDLGSPDQHKYLPPIQPGKIVRAVSEEKALEIQGGIAMDVEVRDEDVQQIIIRARGKGRDTLTLYVDGRAVGSGRIDAKFKELRYDLRSRLPHGMHEVRLSQRGRDPFFLDWVFLRDGTAADAVWVAPTDRWDVRKHGRALGALIGDPPRRWNLHTEIPHDSVLLFDYAGEDVTFEVHVSSDTEGDRQLFSAKGTAEYQEAVVDLSELGGEVVRLELLTFGARSTEASWGDPWLARVGAPPPPPPPPPALRGAIVIVVDTVRQDAFRLYNKKSRVKTPSFDALAEESVLFENAYTNAPWTKPSVTSIMTGLYPSTHGAQTEEAKLSPSLTLISEILSDRGFTTGCYSANGYVSDFFGFTQGWDSFVNFPRKKLRTQADNVYPTALAWLKARKKDERFFLYIQTIDPHVPYQTPGKYLRMYQSTAYVGQLGDAVGGEELEAFNEGEIQLTADDRNFLVASYHAEISYHDDYFGRFIEDVRKLGLLDDVLLVVTNDHGEELFDHGKLDHGQSLHEELIRSPMLVRHPSLFPAGTSDQPVSSVDIAPTILDALGIAPPEQMQGVSLLSPHRPLYSISERADLQRAIRMGPYKMIETLREGRTLYDLRRDPREQRSIASSRPIALRTLEKHLFEGLRVPRKLSRPDGMENRQRFRTSRARLDRAMLEHLKALGYFND